MSCVIDDFGAGLAQLGRLSDITALAEGYAAGDFRHYETIAGAQSAAVLGTAPPNAHVTVHGHAAPGDGGGFTGAVEAADAVGYPGGGRIRPVGLSVTPEMWGAVGDGATDDGPAIQAASDYCESRGGGVVSFDAKTYRSAQALNLNGAVSWRGPGPGLMGIIQADPAVLEGVRVGADSMWVGEAYNITLAKAAFDGATENVGWAVYDAAEVTGINLAARYFKYGFRPCPGDGQRVGYNTFINLRCIGGYRNLTLTMSGDGWVNENNFFGGRMFTTSDTETNVYWNGGNHNRFIGMSAEGTGVNAFFIEGHSNLVEHPRTEGAWTDIPILIGPNALDTTVVAHTLYGVVRDEGSTSYVVTARGSKMATGSNDSHVLNLIREGASTDGVTPVALLRDAYQSSGESRVLRIEMGRHEGEALGCYSDAYGAVHTVSAGGAVYSRLSMHIGQSGWNFHPMRWGNYYFWIDSSHRVRIKLGAPTSETDGVVVGAQS